MNYRHIIIIIFFSFLTNCSTTTLNKNKPILGQDKIVTTLFNGYSNKGFALIYSEDLFIKKIVSNKLSERSLLIFQRNLKIDTRVKITNILNDKSIIGTVGKKSKYPSFNNAVLSIRIAEVLDLDVNEPYVEILEIIEDSIFIAKKAKTYDEEKNVAIKAPVKVISINDLTLLKEKIEPTDNKKFSYIVKIADFYFNSTALLMLNRIKSDNSTKNPKIEKISNNRYRVYLGPFNNIYSLQKSYNDISILEFENIEIFRND